MPDREPDDEVAAVPYDAARRADLARRGLRRAPGRQPEAVRPHPSRLRGYLAWLDSAVRGGTDGNALGLPETAGYAVGEYWHRMLITGRRTPNSVNSDMTAIAAFYASQGIAVTTDRIDVVPVRRVFDLDVHVPRRLDIPLPTIDLCAEAGRVGAKSFEGNGMSVSGDEVSSTNPDREDSGEAETRNGLRR